jgi:hypothetical protein
MESSLEYKSNALSINFAMHQLSNFLSKSHLTSWIDSVILIELTEYIIHFWKVDFL